MADGSWDNSGAPPSRKGMPLWGKVLAGCGVAVLLLTATCAGLAWWGVSKVTAIADRSWTEMDRIVRALKTEAGTRELYRANPGLAESYPTEEEFLKAAEEWRPRLGEFPARRPTLNELVRHEKGGGSFSVNTRNSTTRIEYKIPHGGCLCLQLESDRLVDVRVE